MAAVLQPSELSARDTYQLMVGIITPRPIAWVSTLDAHGQGNLAPFSYFQGVCSRPPTVVLGIAWHADGRPKDTLRNILARREYTISHVGEPLAAAMNETSGAYPPERDEWAVAGLEAAPSHAVAPPRVAQAKAALECRLTHAIPLGQGPTGRPSSTLVVGEVVCFHVEDALLRRDERGTLRPLDPVQLGSVGRMGGMTYTKATDLFDMKRPQVPQEAKATR